VGFGMSATVPALEGMPVYNSDGYGAHLYVPWWMLDRHKELDFPRGYHIEVGGGGFGMPALGFGAATYNQTEGYGVAMKKAIRERYGSSTISLSGRGAMIPNEHSYCEIDPDVKDRWGIPVLRFHWKWSDYEINQVRHMRESFRAILEVMGGTINPGRGGGPGGAGGRGQTPRAAAADAPQGQTPRAAAADAPQGQTPRVAAADAPQMGVGGGVIHEVGCVRMGNDRRDSVVDKYCRAHDVKNLFVADGGPFVSHADKNPTHTIIALAWRTAEYLAEEMKKGNV
jgi:choline dehydrogenase-like flavoprotein